MPAKLKVRILAARCLPVMDRASDLTDAFVEVKFKHVTHKTEVYRKSLNPQWNSEWFRFEVDDEDLQNEPLQIRVLDRDTFSAHDAIGKVYVELNPLLTKEHSSVISGWFPIYDTMHGVRGDLHVIIKLDLFSDFNKFRQSSCGVQFFCTSGVPYCHRLHAVHGFVEELVVNDDPEYQWIDKIRSQRASNEARQIQFSKLSGELQRKIGLKVLELGGNAVIGYRQCFDLEGESGIVVRAIGTSVSLSRIHPSHGSPHSACHSPGKDLSLPDDSNPTGPNSPTNLHASSKLSSSTSPKPILDNSRRLSDSDISTPPKGGSGGSSSGFDGLRKPNKGALPQTSIDIMEYPFFTMRHFPHGFLVHIGGLVSARSVKLLDRIHNPDEPETRDAWWMELRTEVKSHARAMGCYAVVGYREQTTICDEIIILSASGTAAIVNLKLDPDRTIRASQNLTMSLDRAAFDREKDLSMKLHVDVNLANQRKRHSSMDVQNLQNELNCGICHIPYNESSLPFPVNLETCAVCKKKKVPDVIFTTLETPNELQIVGKGCLVQARICRTKKEAKGESNAKEVSDCLPFMEYELYNQLLNKLKVKGMNMLLSLQIHFVVGEQMVLAVATGTGVYAAPLPSPAQLKVLGKANGQTQVSDIQLRLQEAINRNREIHQIQPNQVNDAIAAVQKTNDCSLPTDDEEHELNDVEFSSGNKDAFVLEVDDTEDVNSVSNLLDPPLPDGFNISTTEVTPGVLNMACNLQMFTKVWRGDLKEVNNKSLALIFDNILKSLLFRLRGMVPCTICNLTFDVELPDDEDIQISVLGMAVGLGEPSIEFAPEAQEEKNIEKRTSSMTSDSEADLMFDIEGVSSSLSHIRSVPQTKIIPRNMSGASLASRRMEKKIKYYTGPQIIHGVELSPLSYVPGGHIEQYLGVINFCLIRETTSVRELGGLNGFMQSFLSEVMGICRAHVISLGGNALLSYHMSECVLDDHLHKNQSQCLINVYGDVVQVTYETEMVSPIAKKAGISPGASNSFESAVPSELSTESPQR